MRLLFLVKSCFVLQSLPGLSGKQLCSLSNTNAFRAAMPFEPLHCLKYQVLIG
jgi:hypothetical protein